MIAPGPVPTDLVATVEHHALRLSASCDALYRCGNAGVARDMQLRASTMQQALTKIIQHFEQQGAGT